MPITVNYNPDIELLGEVSYDTGRGLAYLRERQRQEALRQLERQRQDQLRAQDIDRFDRYNFDYMNRVDAGEGRAAQEFQQALARQQQERQFLSEQDRLAEDSRRRYELDRMQLEGVERSRADEAGLRQQQRDYYIQSIEQKRQQQEAEEEQWRQEQAIKFGGEWQLSESDQVQKDAELQQIQQFSQFLLPQEYEQAIQEHERRWRGKEKLVAQQKTPQQEVEGSTYVDERIPGKPIVWHKDRDGSWRPTPIEQDQGEADKQMWEKQKFLYDLAVKNKPLTDDPALVGPYNQLMRNMADQLGVPWQDIMASGNVGAEQPASEPQPEPQKPKLSEMTPEQLREVEQSFTPEQISQLQSLGIALAEARDSGDYLAQTRILMQMEAIYRQNGFEL